MPQGYTTCFRSAVAFGGARVLREEGEKRDALEQLAAEYSPQRPEGCRREIEQLFDRVCAVKLRVERLSGKEAIELAEGR